MNREAGFTLVETSVSAVVLAAGVLGAVASGALAGRLANAGTRRERSAALAAGTAASLAADPCAATSGTSRTASHEVVWTVTAAAARRDLEITVRFADGPTTRVVRFSARLVCLAELP